MHVRDRSRKEEMEERGEGRETPLKLRISFTIVDTLGYFRLVLGYERVYTLHQCCMIHFCAFN